MKSTLRPFWAARCRTVMSWRLRTLTFIPCSRRHCARENQSASTISKPSECIWLADEESVEAGEEGPIERRID